jgi:DNA polymerase-3 subunit delta
MVALKSQDVDAFIAKPDPARPIVLIFGADAGLVRERAEAVINKSVDDVRDPFALVRLEGDALAGDPSRLVEEAHTIPLFGGRRAVWVKASGRSVAPAVEALIASPSAECRAVIEAGDLKRNDKLRVACERAKSVAVIACYPDSERDLARLIDEEMRSAGLVLAPEARAVLIPLLGGDRRASRNEIRKLALYAAGKEKVTLDDVAAVVADASALALDQTVDAAFAGRTGEVETQFTKARVAGTAPGSIISAAQRQVALLHKTRVTIEAGASAESAMDAMVPPVHFRRKTLVQAALTNWTSSRLARVMAQLAAAALDARRQAALAEAIAHRTLLSIAIAARRKD